MTSTAWSLAYALPFLALVLIFLFIASRATADSLTRAKNLQLAASFVDFLPLILLLSLPPARQITFISWAIAGVSLALIAPWLVFGPRWLRYIASAPFKPFPSRTNPRVARRPNILGRLIIIISLELGAVMIMASDVAAWMPTASIAPAVHDVMIVGGDIWLVVFIASLPIGVFLGGIGGVEPTTTRRSLAPDAPPSP
jgi:hypothetical protein